MTPMPARIRTLNRRYPRWLRRLWLSRRDLNAMLGAAAIAAFIAAAQAWDAYTTERVLRIEAQERAGRLERAQALREADEARWLVRFRAQEKGMDYEWRVRVAGGGS